MNRVGSDYTMPLFDVAAVAAAVVVRFVVDVGDPHWLVAVVRLATRWISLIVARVAAVAAAISISIFPQLSTQHFLPAGTADTEQTLQAAVAVVAAVEIAERLVAGTAAVAALFSAARLVVVAEPVELASLVWSYRWKSAGASVGLWQDTST